MTNKQSQMLPNGNAIMENVTLFSTARISGIIHNRLENPTFVANDFVGYQYTSLNSYLRTGIQLNSKYIDLFIAELKQLKDTLETIEVTEKLSK